MKPIHITVLLVSIVAFSLLYYFIFDENDKVSPTFSNLPENQVIEYGTSLNLLSLGLTANDDVDGNVTKRIKSDISSTYSLDVGVYTVIYSVSDLSGNKEEISITLTVIDTTPPEIVINENNKQIVFEVGSEIPNLTSYITMYDNYDNSLIESYLEIDLSSLDINTVGTYLIPINYKDSSNNIAIEAYLEIDIVHEWTDLSYFTYSFINNNTEIRIDHYDIDGPDFSYIPYYIEGLPVTELGDHSFSAPFYTVSGVNIPNTVRHIGNLAFASSNLVSIIIPDSVETIGEKAFFQNQLTSVILSSSLTVIEQETFSFNKLTSIIIPEGIVSIARRAFESNELESIMLPESLESIYSGAFIVNNISTLYIPSSVSLIEGNPFIMNSFTTITVSDYNTTFKSIDGVVFTIDGSELLFYPNKKDVDTYTVPDGVITIGELAFYESETDHIIIPEGVTTIIRGAFWWSTLKTIVLPESLESIGEQAFSFTLFLENISIPKNVNTIERRVFRENEFSFFYVEPENTSFKSVDGVLYSYDGTFLISFPGGDTRLSYTIPAEVTEIGMLVFIKASFNSITILGDSLRFNEDWWETGLSDDLMPTE